MNRCLSCLSSLALGLLVVAAGAFWPAEASAQMNVRQFPASVKRGVMTVTAPPQVSINGSVLQLSPGARIRGPNNMLVMSAQLIGQRYAVNYVLEPQGLVREVWILNQAEVDQQPRGWDTVINFVFASEGDKPKTDDGKTPFDQLPQFPTR